MRFCMITTFFGAHRFGGAAVIVDRLSRALLRRGHQVEVIYDVDAYELARTGEAPYAYAPPDGLRLHPIRSWAGALSPLWTHQTSRMGPTQREIQRIIDSGAFDVIHFHNISLIGGAEILSLEAARQRPVKLMTAHEFWLLCPISSLWRFDREICPQRQCIRCSLANRRPPQLWRLSDAVDRGLSHLDALVFPSQHTLSLHRQHGIRARRLVHLPHFLPEDWASTGTGPPTKASRESSSTSLYFAAAGRLVTEKGFHRLLPLMAQLPGIDLKIGGTGPQESELRRMAKGLPNVHYLGQLSLAEMAQLYAGAVAVVIPSLFYETFGYVAVESLSLGTPVIVHDCGALPELIDVSRGGLTYRNDEELLVAMRRLAEDTDFRHELSARGLEAVRKVWSEAAHMDRYFSLIEEVRGAQPSLSDRCDTMLSRSTP